MSNRRHERHLASSLLLYSRTVALVIIGLLATRWTLNALGPVEFGVLAALTAVSYIVRPLGASLTYGALRHIAILGDGAQAADELRRVIGAFLIISGLLGIAGALVVAIGARKILSGIDLVGVRQNVAWQTLVIVTASSIIAFLFASPFRATLNAREDFQLLSSWDVLQSIVLLFAALAARLAASGHRLEQYAWVQLIGMLVLTVAYAWATLVRHPDARPVVRAINLRQDGAAFVVSAWHFLGELTIWARVNISLLVINALYGPVTGAAFAIGTRVDDAYDRVGRPVTDAMRPALLSAAGTDEPRSMQPLVVAINKFSFTCVLLALIPLIVETKSILRLWLGTVPPWSVLFVQLAAAGRATQFLSLGYVHVMAARNELGRLIVLTAIPQALVLVAVAYGSSRFEWAPWVMPLGVTISTAMVALVIQPVVTSLRSGLPLAAGYREVVLPGIVVAVIGALCGIAVREVMPAGLFRVTVVTAASTSAVAVGAWAFVLSGSEREYLRIKARNRIGRWHTSTE